MMYHIFSTCLLYCLMIYHFQDHNGIEEGIGCASEKVSGRFWQERQKVRWNLSTVESYAEGLLQSELSIYEISQASLHLVCLQLCLGQQVMLYKQYWKEEKRRTDQLVTPTPQFLCSQLNAAFLYKRKKAQKHSPTIWNSTITEKLIVYAMCIFSLRN